MNEAERDDTYLGWRRRQASRGFDKSLRWTCPFCLKINDKANRLCVQCGRATILEPGKTAQDILEVKPRSRYDIALGKRLREKG